MGIGEGSPAINAAEGQTLLPQFVSQGTEGVFVDTSRMGGAEEFAGFADRIFGGGAIFVGLDYAVFARLLHEGTAQPPRVLLAVGLRPFAPERRCLYKAVKVEPDGMSAQYVFEPVTLEVASEVPVYGVPGADGVAAVVRCETVTKQVPARLDFDEFVADLWQKGVRYGIAAAAVRSLIERNGTGRVDVAHGLAPTPGHDATLEEKTPALHRDDSPRILYNGKVDLGQFKNRYPQIAANTPLLRKVPRVLGKPGRKVTGEIIEPELPKDFDLAAQAGPGTRLEQRADGEYVVSTQDGFLTLDLESSVVSVTEKIVSREGVSVRTTGNLSLAGEEFEEHGDVQERRLVEGKHMTFFGSVYGAIVSQGGRVRLAGNISGGKAASPGGSIVAEARASSSTLEAPGGEVRVKEAEGCTLVATSVIVERAVLCQIIAERVEVERSEGCTIAGREVSVGVAVDRRAQETQIAMLVPDVASFQQRLDDLKAQAAEVEAAGQRKAAQAAEIRGNPEMAGFLALGARIARKELALTPAQEKNWGKALARFAPLQRHLKVLETELAGQGAELAGLAEQMAAIETERRGLAASIGCTLGAIAGDTTVRTLAYSPDQPLLTGGQLQSIQARLRAFGQTGERLFSGSGGQFAWRYEPDDGEPAPRA